jgi:hypothetical protein
MGNATRLLGALPLLCPAEESALRFDSTAGVNHSVLLLPYFWQAVSLMAI